MKINYPAIELELVRGCNMSCDFCGNYSLPKTKEYMTRETLASFLSKADQKIKRIELTGRGEPLLHPSVLLYILAIRKAMPSVQISLTTNGKLLNENKIFELYSAGLNILLIDCYNNSLNKFKALVTDCGMKVFTDKINPWSFITSSEFMVYLIADRAVEAVKDKKMAVYSRCGAVNPAVYKKYGINVSNLPLKKKCVMPFRSMFVQYDGSITLCCMDWQGESKYQNVNTMSQTIAEVFFKDKMLNAVRRLIIDRHREQVIPCNRCDYFGGFRQGLLPTLKELESK